MNTLLAKVEICDESNSTRVHTFDCQCSQLCSHARGVRFQWTGGGWTEGGKDCEEGL